ncbi:DUF1778 domain-containing protein [Sulfurimonas sp.]|uniref:type II toxin-antitoxin system TacA family antitoxin n=1 Tax=Sulfurimonas sp. TaxID=2022749 RepID=UPI002B461EDF|nr:DUF1778 domain-containing protein [Sulfurimonas sp.]
MQTAHIDIGFSKDSRFDTKINSGLKEMLKVASTLEGMDLSAFIISAATQKAREVIQQSESLSLNNNGYKKFMNIINHPPKATRELNNLMKLDDLNER